MKFIDYIEPKNIAMNIPFSSKKRLFEQLATEMGEDPKETRAIYDALVGREKIGATSLGNGVALPHGRCLEEKEVKIRILLLNKPVNYESVDDTLVQLIVCIIFPKKVEESHDRLLKNIGALFKKHRVYRALIAAKNKKEIKSIIFNESK